MKHPSYLYGTMHLQDKQLFNFPDSLYLAIDSTKYFALELNPDSMNSYFTNYVNNLGNQSTPAPTERAKSKTLREVLSPAEIEELKKNVPSLRYYNIEDYTIKDVYYFRDRFKKKRNRKDDMPTFVDAFLYTIASDKGKIMAGLERPEDQFSLMDGEDFSDVDTKKILEVFDPSESSEEQMKRLYVTRDLEQIEKFSLSFNERAEKKILSNRNKVMAKSMDSIMALGSLFTAVGTLHLPGKEGIINLLKEKGYTVEPVITDKFINGEEYSFKNLANQYRDNIFESDGYSIKAPGELNDLNAESLDFKIKMYYDLTHQTAYYTSHIKATRTDDYSEEATLSAIMKRLTFGKSKVNITKISREDGYKGKELTCSDATGNYFKIQLFIKEQDIYLAFVTTATPSQEHTDLFFSSLNIFPVKISQNKLTVLDDVGITTTLPDVKPERTLNTNYDSSLQSITYSYSDFARKMTYKIIIEKSMKGYNFLYDSVWSNFVTQKIADAKMSSKTSPRNEDFWYGTEFETDVQSGERLRCLIAHLGNRVIRLVVEYPPADSCDSLAKAFVKKTVFKRPTLTTRPYPLYDSSVSIWLPAIPYAVDTAPNLSCKQDTNLQYVAYKSFDTSTSMNFLVAVKTLSKDYWIEDDSLTLKQWLEIPDEKDSTIENYKFARTNGILKGELVSHEKYTKKKVKTAVFADGRRRYYLTCTFPEYEKNNPNIDSFFYGWKMLKKSNLKVQSSPDQFFSDLRSTDTSVSNYAESLGDQVFFSKIDIPRLAKEITTPFKEDTSKSYYKTTFLLNVLEDAQAHVTLDQLIELNKDTFTINNGFGGRILQLISKNRDSVAAYNYLKTNLVKNANSKKTATRSYIANFVYRPSLAKSLFPECLAVLEDTILGQPVSRTLSYMLDSGIITAKEITTWDAHFLDKSQKARLGKNETVAGNYFEVVTSMKNTEAVAEATQYQFVPFPTLRFGAVRYLLMNDYENVSSAAIDSVAANPEYITNIYNIFSDKNKLSQFPKKFRNQKSMAAGYLYENTEDYDHIKKLEYIKAKEDEIEGKRYNFHLFKVTVVEDSVEKVHLGISGPFSTNQSKYTLDYYPEMNGLSPENFDANKVDAQFKSYIIARKVAHSDDVAAPMEYKY